MVGGFSGCKGILLYDTERSENSGVYGTYEDGQIQIITGDRNELLSIQKETERQYKRKDHAQEKLMAALLLGMIGLLIGAFFGIRHGWFGLRVFFALLVFCVMSYLPLLVEGFSLIGLYGDAERQEQFRRYHACEHAAIYLLSKHVPFTRQNLRSAPIYEAECGTVYSGYLLALAAILSILIIRIPAIGLLRAAAILAAALVLLFLNIFNPWNPFKLLQYPAVAQPGDAEYNLVLAMLEKVEDVWR